MARITNQQIAEYTGASLEEVSKVSKMAKHNSCGVWVIGKKGDGFMGDGFMGVEFPEFVAPYKYQVVIAYIKAHSK